MVDIVRRGSRDRRGPLHRVPQDLPDLLVIIGRIGLVSGAEIENLPLTATKRACAPHHFSALEPTDHDQFIRSRDIEVLPVHLLPLQFHVFADSRHDRMSGIDNPQSFFLVGHPPLERAGCAHQTSEYLRSVSRMQHDEPHAPQHPAMHPVDNRIGHFFMRFVSPPNQNICRIQRILGQAMLRFVQSGIPDLDPVPHAFANRRMDSGGIHGSHLVVFPFMAKLVPDRQMDRPHVGSVHPFTATSHIKSRCPSSNQGTWCPAELW